MSYGPKEAIAQYKADVVKGQTFKTTCPFCPGTFETPSVARADELHSIHYLVHSVPFCKMFDRLDPLEFLQAANEETRRKLRGTPA